MPADSPVLEEERPPRDAADVGRGLDALDTPTEQRTPFWRRAVRGVLPPIVAVVLFIVLWQVLWASAIWPEFKLPSPEAVFGTIGGDIADGRALSIVWTSISRAILGFLLAVVVATPLGLLVATVPLVRSAIGPILTGLQSLPSVAWVPAAVLWFGLTDATIYFVVLMGAVPSIANGLVSGIDQVPPLLPRVGYAMGASRVQSARLIMLPAALPGFLGGLKQGWAFSWRSLMAAEIIATSPSLGFGLGAYLNEGQALSDMPSVIAAIILILIVGIGIELLFFRPAELRVLRARGLGGGP
ncbi:ABC transporter permease [Actinomycetospora atypica]|uniref:ABC transporter permease n=1 Tax=Actinomycetospora atypica TaxID=1290095 RepID=A0ABV9YH78_9PSEU